MVRILISVFGSLPGRVNCNLWSTFISYYMKIPFFFAGVRVETRKPFFPILRERKIKMLTKKKWRLAAEREKSSRYFVLLIFNIFSKLLKSLRESLTVKPIFALFFGTGREHCAHYLEVGTVESIVVENERERKSCIREKHGEKSSCNGKNPFFYAQSPVTYLRFGAALWAGYLPRMCTFISVQSCLGLGCFTSFISGLTPLLNLH